MSLACGTQAEDESPPAMRCTRLIGMADNTGIEQRRRFERILVEEIGAHQPSLVLGKRSVRLKGLCHLIRTRLELGEQIAVTPEEILQDLGKVAGDRRGIQGQYPLHDVVSASLVRGVEIARLGSRLERSYQDSRRIGAQVQRLPVEERTL